MGVHATLLITNDFPPRPGGIQNYLSDLVDRLDPNEVVVYAPRWKGDSHKRFDTAQKYEVIRHPSTLMLPTPDVARRAQSIVADRRIKTVWFGAAAPLALMSRALRDAGAERIIASTHGHEVGWSMLPGTRQVLASIGTHTDVITYVSKYTRRRFAAAFGPDAALEFLPPAVDTRRFAPDLAGKKAMRARYGISEACPTVVCLSRLVTRKGQDTLIDCWPIVHKHIPDAKLVIVGGGPLAERLHKQARACRVEESVIFTGSVAHEELPAHHNIADVFAMPCRTRARGLDVEGLGIVFLEASACGVPVIAGASGGAPEAVIDGSTGYVVDGTDTATLASKLVFLLSNPEAARAMGQNGRAWVQERWNSDAMAHKLRRLLQP